MRTWQPITKEEKAERLPRQRCDTKRKHSQNKAGNKFKLKMQTVTPAGWELSETKAVTGSLEINLIRVCFRR